MKCIRLFLQACLLTLPGFSQTELPVNILHFDDSTLSSFQYYQKDSIDKKFTFVEKESEFRGGNTAWIKFLLKSVNPEVTTKYIKIKRGEKTATQQAKVVFLIDASGNPSDIKVINRDEVHPKIAAEAIRIIQESPKWIPAQQEIFVNDDLKTVEEKVKDKVSKKMSLTKVKSYKMQPLVFTVERE